MNTESQKTWKYGGTQDICWLCLKDLCTKENINLSEGRIQLEGKLVGQKVVKAKINATECVFCTKHIDQIHQELHEEEENPNE